MDESIKFRIRKFKDYTGLKPVVIFDDYKPILTEIIKSAIKDRKIQQDRVYIVAGDPGTGKSTFCLLNSEIHDELTQTSIPIENITRNLDEFEERLSTQPSGSFLVIDEGSELTSDRHGEKKVKEIREKFTIMRKRSHLIFICFTNPLRINTYFREDRFKGVFMCKKRGTVYYYSRDRFLDILPRVQKDLGNNKASRLFLKYSPNYVLNNVPDYNGRLRDPYEHRKDGNIDLKLLVTKKPEGSLSLNAVCERLGINQRTIRNYIDQGIIKPINIGTRRYLDTDNQIKLNEYLDSVRITLNKNIKKNTDTLKGEV